MELYEAEVRAIEQSRVRRANGSCPPVFYGSSSIRQWDTLIEDVGKGVLNLGFGGSTLEACDHFFHRLITPVQPRSLLLYAGDNDLGNGDSVDSVFAYYRSLGAQVLARLGAIPFGFISVKPSPARAEVDHRIREVNERIRDDIEQRPAGYFVDVYSAMVDEAGEPRPELFLADGVHMSRQGYLLWGDLLTPYRPRILNP